MNEWFACRDNKGGGCIQSPRQVISIGFFLHSLETSMNVKVWAVPQAWISAVSETVMWGLANKPKKTESALHMEEKLHNRACNTWSNKPVIDASQTMEEFKSERDHGTVTK